MFAFLGGIKKIELCYGLCTKHLEHGLMSLIASCVMRAANQDSFYSDVDQVTQESCFAFGDLPR